MPSLPPLDGSCTLPEAVDYNIQHNAEHPFYIYSEDGSPNVTTITHLEFGRACHRVAHIVRPNREGPGGQVVAIIAHADTILYQAVVVGLMIAGLVPFPISPRNSPAAVVNLLQKTSCQRLMITETTLKPLLADIRLHLSTLDNSFDLTLEEIPSLDSVYPCLGTETISYPFEYFPAPSKRPGLRDISHYMHSSGSTGLPKAIPQLQLVPIQWSLCPFVTDLRDAASPFRFGCLAQPPFHPMAFYSQILTPVYGLVPITVFPPLVKSKEKVPIVPSPDNVLDHIVRTKTDIVQVVPAFLQAWSHSPKAVEILKSLRVVAFGGGVLAPKLGDYLVSVGINLRNTYGGTEFGAPVHFLALEGDEKEWAWFKFCDRATVRWVSQGDGTYECQLLASETHELGVENLPDVRGYATSDLFERHPTKPYLWRIVGRVDDVIIHTSGEKTVPAPIESIIVSNPIVHGTVIFGQERELAGVLVEPASEHAIDVNDEKQVAELRNKLWPVVEEANRNTPAFSRIYKEMILITSIDKPLPRTGKGTVMRKAALHVYAPEIAALYEAVESGTKGVQPPKEWSGDVVKEWLIEQALDIQSGTVTTIDPTVDLFEQGFDSLSVTFLRHRIVSALQSSTDEIVHSAAVDITQNTIYAYSTIFKLSMYLIELVGGIPEEGAMPLRDSKSEIHDMIEKYSVGLGALNTCDLNSQRSDLPMVVLLTGSTGGLGSQILALLLDDDSISKVYALNRPSSSISILERHQEKFTEKGFNNALLQSRKLVFVESDASQHQLGLSKSLYEELRSSVTVIIHNAWRLNFNLSLASFEPNVQGTRNLIDLSRSSPYAHTLRFLFTSSVASAQSWRRSDGPFPEEVIEDVGVAVGSGYGESKYIAERILAKSGLQATSFRIGQISPGPSNGAWSSTEWLPILVKSSLGLDAFPTAEGVVSWTSIGDVAQTLLDVAFTKEQPPMALNVAHPKPVKWEYVISTIKDAIMQERNVSVPLRSISYRDWFFLLDQRAKTENTEDLQNIPAIKLLEFFRAEALADNIADDETGALVKFSTEKAQAISQTLKNATPIQVEDVQRWVKYWNNVGLFN